MQTKKNLFGELTKIQWCELIDNIQIDNYPFRYLDSDSSLRQDDVDHEMNFFTFLNIYIFELPLTIIYSNTSTAITINILII